MPEIRRILAVKLADLGDVLLCEPALRSLRAGHPNARIDVLTTPASAELIELIAPWANSLVFGKHAFDSFPTTNPRAFASASRLAVHLRSARYDLVVLLHHLVTRYGALKFAALVRATGATSVAGLDNGRGGFLTHPVRDHGFGHCHEADYMRLVAEAAGGAVVDRAPRINISEPVQPPDLPTSYVAIFPATGWFSRAREWPASRFAELSFGIESHGLSTAILGGDDARGAATIIRESNPQAIDLTGRTNLKELIAAVSAARLVVGGDSFIGHLAAALQRPVVSIFGPSNYRAWGPYGSVPEAGWCPKAPAAGIIVSDDLPCSPCLYTGYALGRREGCPTRTCLDRISVDRVMQAVVRLIDAQ